MIESTFARNIAALLLFLFITGFASNSSSQTSEYTKILENQGITLHTDDNHKLVFHVKELKSRPNHEKTYYWYDARRIHISQGGYSGKVLHGTFTDYFPNQSLHKKGVFKNGHKIGVWNDWNEQGELLKWSTWKKNEETGLYMIYDGVGNITESGTLSAGLKDGKIYHYSLSDSLPSLKYFNQGIEISAEQYHDSQGIWHRTMHYLGYKWQSIFRKKNL